MLMKSDKPPPTLKLYARGEGFEARMAEGVPCPCCGRDLRPSDTVVDAETASTMIICGGCHRDIFRVDILNPAPKPSGF
jgi:hypothetical protein